MIEVKNLSLWRENRQLLFDISAVFPDRTATAILGPSGCGKSTLIKSLNRIHDEREVRYSGSVILNGEQLLSPENDLPKLRRRVGMVFQTPCPFDMSIEKNIVYPIKLEQKLPPSELKIRVEQALRQAALFDEVKDRLRQNALSLSGGQQQRLCIARALAAKPEVLLLDEPTSALDPLSTEKIEQLIIKLKRELTVILVTHSARQALCCCDYAIFMRQGSIIERSTAQRLIKSPKTREAKEFFGQRG